MKIAVKSGHFAQQTPVRKPFALSTLAATWIALGLGCSTDTRSVGSEEPEEDVSAPALGNAWPDASPYVAPSQNSYDAGANTFGSIPLTSTDAGRVPLATGFPSTGLTPGGGPIPGLNLTGIPSTATPGIVGTGIPGLQTPGFDLSSLLSGLNIPGLNIPGLNIPGFGSADAGVGKRASFNFPANASATKLASGSPEFLSCYTNYIACNAGGKVRDCVVKGIDEGCLASGLLVCIDEAEACSPQTGLGPGISSECTQVMADCLCQLQPNEPGKDIACR